MNYLRFQTFVAMEPVAKARPRMTKQGHTYTPSATVQAEHRIQTQVSNEWRSSILLGGPLAIHIVVHLLKPKSTPKKKTIWPVTRPDVDNYGKLVLDALNGILWRDDSQVVDLHIKKVYSECMGFDLQVFQVDELVPAC